MKFNFRNLLITKTLALTFVLLILMGNFMLVPRLFGKTISPELGLVFNILIYLSILQSFGLLITIIWRSYFFEEEDQDDSEG